MQSILTSIKKMLGPSEENTSFDSDIIFHINTAFSILTQLGIGPTTGFSISDSSEEWSDFTDLSKIEMVKSFIFIKVKLIFDPPTSSTLLDAYKMTLSELEWRITNSGESTS